MVRNASFFQFIFALQILCFGVFFLGIDGAFVAVNQCGIQMRGNFANSKALRRCEIFSHAGTRRLSISSIVLKLVCREEFSGGFQELPRLENVAKSNGQIFSNYTAKPDGLQTDGTISRTIQDILSIASDSSLSEIERIQLIRSALPAPIFPYETEPGMMGETRVAKSFGHLNDLLFLDSWAEHSDKLGPCKLYRGVPDSSMELLTSLQRLVEPTNHIKSSKAMEMGAVTDVPTHLSLAAMKRIEQVKSYSDRTIADP